MKAVVAYQKKLNGSTRTTRSLKFDQEMENKRKMIVRSFSLARNLYATGHGIHPSYKESELAAGAEFLEVYPIDQLKLSNDVSKNLLASSRICVESTCDGPCSQTDVLVTHYLVPL